MELTLSRLEVCALSLVTTLLEAVFVLRSIRRRRRILIYSHILLPWPMELRIRVCLIRSFRGDNVAAHSQLRRLVLDVTSACEAD